MTTSKDDIIARAVERIAEEADGNGVTRDQVLLKRGHVEERVFRWIVTCDGTVLRRRRTAAGAPDLADVQWNESAAELERSVEEYAHLLSSSPGFETWPLDAVAQRADFGFDTASSPVVVESTARTFGHRRSCAACEGAAEVACLDCDGDGRLGCSACNGAGSRFCVKCLGSGQRQVHEFDPVPDVFSACPDCTGGRVRCASCGGNGHVSCVRCGGRGAVPCEPCEGHGHFTDWVEVAVAGELSGAVEWAELPEPHRRAIEKIGVPNLIYGHADVLRTGVEGGDRPPRTTTFHVRLPVGEVTTEINGQSFAFDVVGREARTVPRQPFLEALALKGAASLGRAAHGPVRRSKKWLREAMTFGIVRTAIDAHCGGGSPEWLRLHYPSLEFRQAHGWITLAHAALEQVNELLARRWRRVWLVAMLLALFFWFPLELRELFGGPSYGFYWGDGVLLVALPLMATAWIRWRQRRQLQSLWYACRRDPEARRRHFRHGVGFPDPDAGAAWIVVGLVLISIVALESGWQTGNFRPPSWDVVRQPIARVSDWAWQAVEPSVARAVEQMVDQ